MNTLDNLQGTSYGQMLFIVIGIIPVLLCVPCWAVGKFIYEPMLKQSLRDQKEWDVYLEDNKMVIPYAEKYPLKDLSGCDVKIYNIIIDETPNGNVAMKYNKEESGFEYWADRSINYNELETVARKYVNSFGCTELYIDRKKHLNDKMNKLTQQIAKNFTEKNCIEKTTRIDDVVHEDVFVKLKGYNQKIKQDEREKMLITRDDYVCDVANKYIRMGKFDENAIKTPVKTTEDVITWDTWNYTKND
tara:strand:- start:3472 stop:4209 length:738 start_codon:yes stop_codon:yes gene_type:complete